MMKFVAFVVAATLGSLGLAACVSETGDEVAEQDFDVKGGKGGGKKCNDPSRSYVSHDPQECQLVKFFCESGVAFFDQCGCGCVNEPPPAGEPCNQVTCGAGEFCCNYSCSTCAPEGGFCTQVVCESQ